MTTVPNSDFDDGMKTRLILIVGLIVLPIAVVCNFPPTLQGAGADEKAVRDADEAWSKAAGSKDVDKTVAFYADDAVVMPPNAERATTKEAIRKIWKDLLTDAKVSWKATKVEVAKSGDIGFISGTYEVAMNDVVTGKPVNGRTVYQVKDGARWMFFAFGFVCTTQANRPSLANPTLNSKRSP